MLKKEIELNDNLMEEVSTLKKIDSYFCKHEVPLGVVNMKAEVRDEITLGH